MALGASPVGILQLVLQRGMILTLAGLFVGMLSALALTRLLTNPLFEISPLDPVTFFSAGAIIFVVILLGCYFPARRAARVDPMVALRCE
jgi:putative ABC transport system permease protein